jgi:hypothetical protein
MSWRRIFLLAAALIAVIAGSTWFVLQRSGAATGLVRKAIAQALAAPFQLGRAQVDLLDGRLSVQEFTLPDPSRPGRSLVAVDDVRLSVETDPLGGVLAIHDISVQGAHLDLDLTAGHAPRLADLLHKSTSTANDPNASQSPAEIIPIHVTGTSLRIRIDASLPDLEIQDLELHLQRNQRDDGAVDATHGSLTGRARIANFDLPVELRGDLDLATGASRVQASVIDTAIDERLLQSLLKFINADLPADAVRGKLRHLLLWSEATIGSGNPPVFGAGFQLDDVHSSLDKLPVPLRGASMHGVADTRGNGSARVTASNLLPDGETEVIAKVTGLFTTPQIEVRGKGRNIALDETVSAAMRSFPAGFAVVDGLRPTAGRADFDLFLRDPGQPTEIVDLDLGLKGVALSYNGFGDPDTRVRFPLPVVEASGHVHLRSDILSIEDVTAHLAPEAGGGDVRMSGRVNVSHEHRGEVHIDLDVPKLTFTTALRTALGTLVRDDGALYDQFQPRGAAAVRLQVRPQGDPEGQWQVQIDALGGELTWSGFPLTLSSVQGRVLASDDGMKIDLSGRRGDATLEVKGVLQSPAERPGAITSGPIDLRIRAAGVPLDSDLRTASVMLSPDLEAVWKKLSPTGICTADLSVRRANGDAETGYDLAMQVANGTAKADALPIPITDLHGDVFVHGMGKRLDVQIDAIRGRLQEHDGRAAQMALVGIVKTHPTYAEDLTIVVRQLELDTALGQALEASGGLTPGTWAALKPSGTVDVISHQARNGDAAPQLDHTVLMRDVRSDAEMLPQPATDVTGELEIRGGSLAFRSVRARLGGALVNCSAGRVGATGAGGRTEVAMQLSAERFPLDDNFARLFLGPMRQAVLDRQLRGLLNVHSLSLGFLLPTAGTEEQIEVTLKGNFEAIDVEALLGTRLQAVNGFLELDDSRVNKDGGLLRGRFTRGSFRLLGHGCDEAQAEFEADPSQFTLRSLDLRVHGGKVAGRDPAAKALAYRFARSDAEPGVLSTDLQVRGVALNEFLRDCGLVDAPYSGTLEGTIRLNELHGADLVDLDAEGALAVFDGNLGQVPLFTSIYALMDERSRPRFDQMSVQFKTKDRVLELSNLQLSSPLVAVRGEGSLTLDGYLYVVLTTDNFFGGNADMLVLPQVLQWVTSSIVRFHLFGYLRDLRAEKRWIAQRSPRRQMLTPIPPRVTIPKRSDF